MSKIRKTVLSIGIGLIIGVIPLSALELHNLELVAELSVPDSNFPGAFGIALASGDLNGDGFSDIVVGRGWLGTDKSNCICIYYGGTTVHSTPDVIIKQQPEDQGWYFGANIAVGDINGDGYDDVIVAGGAYTRIYYGGNPMDTISDLIIPEYAEGITPKCGDLNKDGYDDIAISCSYDNWVKIYSGGPVPDANPDITLYRSHIGDRLSSGYDVNGDGYDDLMVTALGLSTPSRVYIYYGGNPMDTVPDVTMTNPVYPGSFYGEAIALTPDLNSDGYNDAFVGMGPYNPNDTVYGYWGGNLMNNGEDMIFSDSGNYYGYTVTGLKKADTKKSKLLCIGAPRYPLPSDSILKGRVYIYLGGTVIDTTSEALATGVEKQKLGGRVADAGDVNGDGCDEIMFSNYFSNYPPLKVWVCKYTGPGIEEKSNIKNQNVKLEILKNPFVKSTIIRYQLPSNAKVSLKLYDLSGRCVKEFVNEEKPAGDYKIELNSKDYSAGVYFIKLTAGSYEEKKKLIIMK